jgi:hypothetical protein
MTDPGKNDDFKWQTGETLDEGNSAPLGDIRAHGLGKLNKALAKDPATRKREREKFLAEQQSRPYKTEGVTKREDVLIEEGPSASDLSGKYENSEVQRLTGKGNRTHGLFGKKS